MALLRSLGEWKLMKLAIIPMFLFETADIAYLKEKQIKFDTGTVSIGQNKVNCYRFYNLNEMELFDELKSPINEDNNAMLKNYASRVASLLFLRIRQIMTIQDATQKLIASVALMSAVNSLANIDVQYGNRFVSLLRSIC